MMKHNSCSLTLLRIAFNHINKEFRDDGVSYSERK